MIKNSIITTGRINSLDYLRGLAAFGIMIYHLHLFTYGEVDSSDVLAKIKIYGVSIFYVLSGLTLYLVNIKSFAFTKSKLTVFYIKRFFRIVPLLWMATALTLIVSFSPDYLNYRKIIANITVLPGALKPETFIANGAWSIGDELFFYMLFPFLLWLAKANKWAFSAFALFSLLLLSYFSFYKIHANIPLGEQESAYVNPLGQMFYFVMGISLGIVERNLKNFGRWAIAAIIFLGAVIVFYPVTGNPAHLVTGFNRLILSACVILFCFLFYKCDFSFLPGIIKTGLTTLGEISFSVYLIHPIIYAIIKSITANSFISNPFILLPLNITVTLIVSYFNYVYFEKYFVRVGNSITAKYKKPLMPV
ncbi:acyltransferase family protein [Mucilaginibacter sp. SP1R1]|uniref:acyltransferase family protein n=1 Tax=Mucilaginibacter sp. SP1R1 TaxID=2723091 RepID=UPI00160FAF5D|nr:acyltransferase [Mucilaginibacter sp. SP1R1]MBB6150348.1 peptidoglycan/LPS O-acetylase OafA/YrhL [Mucilaginibacter sp. SP1R1]